MGTIVKLAALALLIPISALASTPKVYDIPDTGYVSNTVIDIIPHDGGLWFASGKGINLTYDGGLSWFLTTQGRGWSAPTHRRCCHWPDVYG